ncbi:MAG: hypothetical protein VKS61_13660 [Candidatus Sericytochromatia bacterium]|nr:hypothetical protein [Candidatus Sericytochromatia bacterium]
MANKRGAYDLRAASGSVVVGLAGVLAATMLVGCGAVPGALTNQASGKPRAVRVASDDTNLSRTDGGKTEVGNQFRVRVYRDSADDTKVRLDVTYEDRATYFTRLGPALELGAWAEVILASGRKQEFPKLVLQRVFGGTTMHKGSFHVAGVSPSDEVRSVALAFHYGGLWDSNDGKNYVVKF